MQTGTHKPEKLWSADFILLILSNTISSTAFFIIVPIIMQYATGIGIPLGLAGVLTGAFSLTSLFMRPISGFLVDRFSKRLAFAAGAIVLALSTFGLSFIRAFPLMLLLRCLQGVGFALFSTACTSWASCVMPKDRIGQGVSYFSLSSLLSMTVGPTLGIELGKLLGFEATLKVAALLPIFSLLPVFLVHRNCDDIAGSQREASQKFQLSNFFSIRLMPFLLFSGIFSFANALISSYMSLHAEARGIAAYSAFFVINSVILVLVRPLAGRLTDKKGFAFTLIPAYFFTILTMVCIGAARSYWWLFAAAILAALGIGVGLPTCQSECIRRLPLERRGVAVGTYYTSADLAQGIAPMVGSRLVSHGSYASMFYISGAFVLMVAMLFILWNRGSKREKQEKTAA